MTEWAERAADRAPAVSERRSKAVEHTTNIVAAARRLIVTRVEPFTIQDLVREAGIGLPTFYRHFGSKDELLLAVIGDLIGDACDEYERQAQAFDDPLDRLQSYISSTLATVGDERIARFATGEFLRLRQLFPDEMNQVAEPFVQLILRAIQDAQAQGTVDPADPVLDAGFISELVITVYHRCAWSTADRTPEEVASQLHAFVLNGLRARGR